MSTLQEQFRHQALSDHFEPDPHREIRNAKISGIRVLHGETADDDLLVVQYQNSPNLSFYNVRGRLIDVDHYLPDNYPEIDEESVGKVLENLAGVSPADLQKAGKFKSLLTETFEAGNGKLYLGLRKKLGLSTTAASANAYKKRIGFKGKAGDFLLEIMSRYTTFGNFLMDFLGGQMQAGNGYVHFTPNDNIVITTLNKRSGMAVIIETKDVEGHLLPPSRWLITRTVSESQLNQALVFRSEDIKAFFTADGYETVFTTDRYELKHREGGLEMDSLLDNTDNLLKVALINDCYQVLASDRNILVALTKPDEVMIINTHRSVVPSRWARSVQLPAPAAWVRADENLVSLFAQDSKGGVTVYDISQAEAVEVTQLGTFTGRFALDATGSLIARTRDGQELLKISTNAPELELPGEQQNFTTAFKNLSHLFKGESLFTRTSFARPVAEVVEETKALPSAVEVARYDFETNIEHLLADAGEDYKRLLGIQEKIAIARTNIAEELTRVAEEENILLVGQRLQSTINNIVRPVERRVRGLVEETRAQQIITQARGFKGDLNQLSDPGAYREILNTIRGAAEELNGMNTGDIGVVITEFRGIQKELNKAFSEQIAEDGTNLQTFITQEIEQIESAITAAHDPRQLENLLSTHPAAVELFNLLKQPFVLQSIAREQRLSPTGIQTRLHAAVNTRRGILNQERERKEAEINAAKVQLAEMIRQNIEFFVNNHTGSFSDLELADTAAYQEILRDTGKLEEQFNDVRLARELRQRLERRILERNRADLEKMVAFEGKYAFIQNDPDLFVDLDSTVQSFPRWHLELVEKPGQAGTYLATFVRDTDKEVFRPTSTDNLKAGRAYEIGGELSSTFLSTYDDYVAPENSYELLAGTWAVATGRAEAADFPQFNPKVIAELQPEGEADRKALGCALETKRREHLERKRERNVPVITPEFIDDTPYFQQKLKEFIIKAKLQLMTNSGVILLSGPPSTGKSAFLKFAAAVMNREYFEHAADKWQTKNSLVTAIKFGENGPYTTPAGFTKAVTTPHSLLNIEEIKEWPEALRKSLNPFFAGSNVFLAPDGTAYQIGKNLLLCAAANLGAIYRADDEPFTADFWSRIEVVEYNYSPYEAGRDYLDALHAPPASSFLTMRELARDYFGYRSAPTDARERAKYLARVFLEFLLLPKADEKIKRDNLQHELSRYFSSALLSDNSAFGPEEAAKIALRRMKDFQGYSPRNFFDLYDHFVNRQPLRSPRLAKLQTADVKKYEHLRVLSLTLYFLEGCLRNLRDQFYSSAGQTEIEGTNREFINAVYLLEMVGA